MVITLQVSKSEYDCQIRKSNFERCAATRSPLSGRAASLHRRQMPALSATLSFRLANWRRLFKKRLRVSGEFILNNLTPNCRIIQIVKAFYQRPIISRRERPFFSFCLAFWLFTFDSFEWPFCWCKAYSMLFNAIDSKKLSNTQGVLLTEFPPHLRFQFESFFRTPSFGAGRI